LILQLECNNNINVRWKTIAILCIDFSIFIYFNFNSNYFSHLFIGESYWWKLL